MRDTDPMDQSHAHPALAALAEGFAPDLFLRDPDLVAPLTRDRTGAYAGEPVAVVRPRSAPELAAVVRRCRALGLGVVPQGGLTGLVGAAVSGDVEREVLVLLDRMAAVRSVDPVGFAMVVEAGCVLESGEAMPPTRRTCSCPSPSGRRARPGSGASWPPTPAASTSCATA